MFAGRATGEALEVANEVRLIGIAARRRRNRAALSSGVAITFEKSDRALESRDACEPFRRHTHNLAELPFHVPPGHAHPIGDAID